MYVSVGGEATIHAVPSGEVLVEEPEVSRGFIT